MLSLVPALMLFGIVQAQAQVAAPGINVTGGYVCQGNCAAPGRCARAYFDGWWAGRPHISFYNELGVFSEGTYTAPNRVVAITWRLGGVVYPNQIVWYRPGSPRPYARWIRSAACWF